MGIAPVPREKKDAPVNLAVPQADSVDWVRIAAGGALIAGGLLLLSGQRRAAMAAAATGTALAMLDQQESLRRWWDRLPVYVDQVQDMIGQVQSTVDDLAAKRDALRQALNKTVGTVAEAEHLNT
jgi:hypothetical protein